MHLCIPVPGEKKETHRFKTYGTATQTSLGQGFVMDKVDTQPLCLLNEVNGSVTLIVPESLRASLEDTSDGTRIAQSFMSLSLSLSHELYRSPLPIDFTPRFTSFATNGTFKIEDSSLKFLPLSSYSLHFVLSRAGRRESLIP